jgi:predicted alpha/beta superfamily hydrolase
VTGTLLRYESFPSRLVASRKVDVWLPPGYDRDTARRFPVLYAHDGQNLFEPATSFGGGEWGLDETLTRLVAEGRVRPAIVVGVWNTSKRYQEYMPQKAVPGGRIDGLDGLPVIARGEILSDAYLRFLVTELKPFVDSRYRTRPDRDGTLVMGSSMGGLVSAYAISEYPQVFGAAACLSTHWPAGDGVAIDYLEGHLPDPRTHRIYFDRGTRTLDALYGPFQDRMDEVMRRSGWTPDGNWVTRTFEGADHSEASWSQRAEVPLVFLLRD